MKGYVKNKSAAWTHAMKRAVGPGATIPLKELYEQYGKKHGLAKGDEFVNWLREVKLRDTERWEVTYGSEEVKAEAAKEAEAVKNVKEIDEDKHTTKAELKKISVEDVVNLSVRKARELLPRITDAKLLKYALKEAEPRAGKDSLCRILRKRILDIQISR